MTIIRTETPSDYEAIRIVNLDAFGQSEFGHQGEADLVDDLRSHCSQINSIVATNGNQVIGHLLFSPVTIKQDGSAIEGMGLAPMAVATHCQRQGVGTALIETGLDRLSEAGCPFVVVLGHPDYYTRFGFELAGRHGIQHGFDGIPQDVFFVKFFKPLTTVIPSEPMIRTVVAYYRPEFGQQSGTTGNATQ